MKIFLSIILFALTPVLTFGQINSGADDYGSAFRTLPDGKMEFWFTTGRDAKDGRSRALFIAPCAETGFGKPYRADTPLNLVADNLNPVVLNGTPSFAACDGNHGVFGSNRLVNGKYFGNDIYEIRFNNGKWDTTRINEINSNAWDDSPALSPDGSRIYFASDRLKPGTRQADLFMSEFIDGHWTEPKYLPEVNTPEFSEETPFVGEDGFLYYSTNRSGDYDIVRAKLNNRGLPESEGQPIPFADINQKGTDQTHPCFSPGGSFFVYSTNASEDGHRKDFDIKWVRIQNLGAKFDLDVRKRYPQSTVRFGTKVHFITGSHEVIIRSSPSLVTQLSLSDFLIDASTPAYDTKNFKTIIYAETDTASFISAIDTLFGSRTCSSFNSHTLFLWDTATYYERHCIDTFPIKKVKYFVTGYWCPTTSRYSSYASCTSLFLDKACLHPVCDPSDLDSFHVQVLRKHSDCIDYKEFEKHGSEYSNEVDDAIEQHLRAMESAFSSACMKKTISQGKPVTVIIDGFTDPLGYKSDCQYFGPNIDFSQSFVQVPDSMKDHFKYNTHMKKYGLGGNQLLSELRAYNLAVLLDRLWTKNIDQYAKLKQKGLLTTLAVGRAIDQDNIPFDQRRSAQVSISAQSNDIIQPGLTPPPGECVILCEQCTQKK